MANKIKNNFKEIKVSSKTENLSKIRDFVGANASTAGVSQSTAENIVLAVDEACTNIIKHAYKSSPDGEIIIKIEYDEYRLTITIIDYGKSFEPERIPQPDLRKYYQERKVGGLGMYLMKSLMDDVKYTSIPGKYNQVLLSKKLRGS